MKKEPNARFLEMEINEKKALNNETDIFWTENPVFHEILLKSRTLEEARERIFNYLADFERKILQGKNFINVIERKIAKKAINILKNIFSFRSEKLTKFSALSMLFNIAHGRNVNIELGFIVEFRHLFLAMKGKTGLYSENAIKVSKSFREAYLQKLARYAQKNVEQYSIGLDAEIIREREENRARILRYFNASERDWSDWQWQVRNTVKHEDVLADLITLSFDEKKAIKLARENKIPFGVTPYYISLMDADTTSSRDHAIRAQVIPTTNYVNSIIQGRDDQTLIFDFMGESETSPRELVTRRYPMIAIMKPFNTCAQICVYCQRNWEIEDVLSKKAQQPFNKIKEALEWFWEHKEISEILITGGDPAIMSDEILEKILDIISCISHIKRIRIGTRTPVVLPMRFTSKYVELLSKHHVHGKREVVVMTHFEHAYEVTPETMTAIQKIRNAGISVYNQGVFTYENARRFEMVALRKALRLIGVEPYYTFNAKGKEETTEYRVPIARLLQEQAEEARLNPGLERTDEAVFNVPKIGKSYLRAGQDRELIMINNQGQRIYEFYPWDVYDAHSESYLFADVPILNFINEMSSRGEDVEEYKSIWYYY